MVAAASGARLSRGFLKVFGFVRQPRHRGLVQGSVTACEWLGESVFESTLGFVRLGTVDLRGRHGRPFRMRL